MSFTLDLPDGYIDLPQRKIAAIQTFLEMHERPAPRPDPPVTATLQRVTGGVERYLDLFHRVGDAYLWFSRLAMPLADVAALLGDPDYEAYAVEQNGSWEGLVELDFRAPEQCELRYFGLAENLVGTGVGRFAMNRAIEYAWARPIRRFWVHTCTLDHSGALAFYRRSGFVPYARKIEIADDPRLAGIIARDAAPQVPLFEAAS